MITSGGMIDCVLMISDDSGIPIPNVDEILGTSTIVSQFKNEVKSILSISWVTASSSIQCRQSKHLPSIASSLIESTNEFTQYKDKIEFTAVMLTHMHS